MNKLTVVHLDGIKITSKESFLKEIAEALEFPDYFGHNWDALEDCLKDLKGKYLIIWTDTDNLNNEAYNQAIKILDKVIDLELIDFNKQANLEYSRFYQEKRIRDYIYEYTKS